MTSRCADNLLYSKDKNRGRDCSVDNHDGRLVFSVSDFMFI